VFAAAAARADLRPGRGRGWALERIDCARPSVVSGSGVSSSSSGALEG
jgi:hypothetical protein